MDTFAAVVITNAIDYFRGSFNDRILRDYKEKNNKCTINKYHFGELYSFVDLYQVNTREKVDHYSAMSGLARNLSLSFFLFVIFNIFYTFFFREDFIWSLLVIKTVIGTGFAVILMLRADMFRQWSHCHLLHVFHMMQENQNKK